MEYKFSYKTDEEKEKLIKDNSNFTLIKISEHLGESFLIFTDEEIVYDLTETEILGNKISILTEKNNKLEQDNQQIKQEQADLLFMLMENNII